MRKWLNIRKEPECPHLDFIKDNIYHAYMDLENHYKAFHLIIKNDNQLFIAFARALHDMLNDLKKANRSSIWLFVKHISCKDDIEAINNLSNVTTEEGKCKAWMFQSLQNCIFSSYLRMWMSESDVLSQHYQPQSVMRNNNFLVFVESIFQHIDPIEFGLNLNCEYLDGNDFVPHVSKNQSHSAVRRVSEDILKSDRSDDVVIPMLDVESDEPSTKVIRRRRKKVKKRGGHVRNISPPAKTVNNNSVPVSPLPQVDIESYSKDVIISSNSSYKPESEGAIISKNEEQISSKTNLKPLHGDVQSLNACIDNKENDQTSSNVLFDSIYEKQSKVERKRDDFAKDISSRYLTEDKLSIMSTSPMEYLFSENKPENIVISDNFKSSSKKYDKNVHVIPILPNKEIDHSTAVSSNSEFINFNKSSPDSSTKIWNSSKPHVVGNNDPKEESSNEQSSNVVSDLAFSPQRSSNLISLPVKQSSTFEIQSANSSTHSSYSSPSPHSNELTNNSMHERSNIPSKPNLKLNALAHPQPSVDSMDEFLMQDTGVKSDGTIDSKESTDPSQFSTQGSVLEELSTYVSMNNTSPEGGSSINSSTVINNVKSSSDGSIHLENKLIKAKPRSKQTSASSSNSLPSVEKISLSNKLSNDYVGTSDTVNSLPGFSSNNDPANVNVSSESPFDIYKPTTFLESIDAFQETVQSSSFELSDDNSSIVSTDESFATKNNGIPSLCRLNVDDGLRLHIMLDIVKNEVEETLLSIYRTCEGNISGSVKVIDFMITSKAVYFLLPGRDRLNRRVYRTKHAIPLSEIYYFSTYTHWQGFTVVCHDRRRQYWVDTGDEDTTRQIFRSLAEALELNSDATKPKLDTESVMELLMLKKFVSSFVLLPSSEIDIKRYALTFFAECPHTDFNLENKVAPPSDVTFKEGVLGLKQRHHLFPRRLSNPFTNTNMWKNYSFFLSQGILYRAEIEGLEKKEIFLKINAKTCSYCRRSGVENSKRFTFLIKMSNGEKYEFAANSQLDLTQWQQAINNSLLANGSDFCLDRCRVTPVCTILTNTYIVLSQMDTDICTYTKLSSYPLFRLKSVALHPSVLNMIVLEFDSEIGEQPVLEDDFEILQNDFIPVVLFFTSPKEANTFFDQLTAVAKVTVREMQKKKVLMKLEATVDYIDVRIKHLKRN